MDLSPICLRGGGGRLHSTPASPLIQGPLKQGFGSLHFQDNEFGDEVVVFCASYRDIQRKNLGPEVRGTQSRPGVKPRALRLHEIELDPV